MHSVFGYLGDDTMPKERQKQTIAANMNIHNSIMEEDGNPEDPNGASSKNLEI